MRKDVKLLLDELALVLEERKRISRLYARDIRRAGRFLALYDTRTSGRDSIVVSGVPPVVKPPEDFNS
jgi:hypothetical protein